MQAAAAIMMELPPGAPLDQMLQMLDEHLVSALEGRMEGPAVNDFRRAEAITDRLLEARQPFEWIPHEQYSLQSRLRQIQSMADRVLAMLETGAPREDMMAALQVLRGEVVRLREIVAQGGTRAPPPLRLLLQGGDTAGLGADRERRPATGEAAPAAPRPPAPIGAPVGTPVPGRP
jgi:hypothetical protein